jgi:hypothetical protein
MLGAGAGGWGLEKSWGENHGEMVGKHQNSMGDFFEMRT